MSHLSVYLLVQKSLKVCYLTQKTGLVVHELGSLNQLTQEKGSLALVVQNCLPVSETRTETSYPSLSLCLETEKVLHITIMTQLAVIEMNGQRLRNLSIGLGQEEILAKNRGAYDRVEMEYGYYNDDDYWSYDEV